MKKYFTGRWILAGVVAIAGALVSIRMGLWQLDRLEQRRTANDQVLAQIYAPELDLNQNKASSDLVGMEYRKVVVSGVYDDSQEVLLRNQAWEGRLGYHVLTPLIIDGSNQAVLVERGWIPFEDGAPELRVKYAEPGLVTVRGVVRLSQFEPDFGGVPDPTLAAGEDRLDAWYVVNLERIQQQVDLELLPVYIQQKPETGWTGPPYRSNAIPEVGTGAHLGFALQWFSYAAILTVGFPFYVRRQVKKQDLAKAADKTD